ncbi:hypothetical protein LPB140_04730 [Sphingorhabdus lutea]|uniref:Glycerophosphoryl diester phosphodiesterase membrane domain-containing protein n=1 Tax=Sphingorhabdus lutea TaxID=1913578 RepID=A0A1L3JAR8_9SPHN|nr:hypothetical protein [Sphingorhabdus lutea]APG62222.1 hypothetical protein LPB140_04730 [Sphingorhabdus lutea]
MASASNKFDYMVIWDDAMSLLQKYQSALFPIAAVFIFLPNLILGYFAPEPDTAEAQSLKEIVQIYGVYFNENLWLILPMTLVGIFGGLAVYHLLVRGNGRTIGEVLSGAAAIFIPYFLVSILSGFMVAAAALFFIIPAFYVAGRLYPLAAIVANKDHDGIIGAISKSWEMTKGRGWSIIFLVFVVAFVAVVASSVIMLLFGLMINLILGDSGKILLVALDSVFQAVLVILMSALGVSIYNQLKKIGN